MKSENLIIKKLDKLEREIKGQDKPPLWLTISELSDYIKLSKSSIRSMVKQDQIPYQRAGTTNKLIFNRLQISYWLLLNNPNPTKRDKKRYEQFVE